MDKNFVKFNLTRASHADGRDAIGLYKIDMQTSILTINCARVAICYSPLNGCHVKQTNRLIYVFATASWNLCNDQLY